MNPVIVSIVKLLESHPLTLSTEAALQLQIENLLKQKDISYAREVRLDTKNRIDFLCSGVGLEVKIKQSAKSIYRQLERYALFPEIRCLVLVTGTTMGLPENINGKPCYIVRLGKAWL